MRERKYPDMWADPEDDPRDDGEELLSFAAITDDPPCEDGVKDVDGDVRRLRRAERP